MVCKFQRELHETFGSGWRLRVWVEGCICTPLWVVIIEGVHCMSSIGRWGIHSLGRCICLWWQAPGCFLLAPKCFKSKARSSRWLFHIRNPKGRKDDYREFDLWVCSIFDIQSDLWKTVWMLHCWICLLYITIINAQLIYTHILKVQISCLPQTFDHSAVKFTFSLYSSLMMEQFTMEGDSSLGMVITWVTVSFPEDATDSVFALTMSFVETLLRPWAKKLFFSYRTNLGFTERDEWLVISTMTWRSSPVK